VEIRTISVMLPLRVTSVNVFLLKTGNGWILIDTACSNNRDGLVSQIESAGCERGKLKLIVLTHGDFDHTGNARYLRDRFGAPIVMHRDDLGMVEQGDMYWNRGKPNRVVKALAPVVFGFRRSDRFSPDLFVEDGFDLSQYGPDLRVVHLPGHSQGSIGLLTGEGELFCGDLLINEKEPVLNHRVTDAAAARASLARLQGLEITTVFPSHGRQFRMVDFNPGVRM
jgi:hydroxyacylglutathione hydrolase